MEKMDNGGEGGEGKLVFHCRLKLKSFVVSFKFLEIIRIVWQTVKRVTIEISGVKGLRRKWMFSHV